MRVVNRWTLGAAFALVFAVGAVADGGKTFVMADECDPRDPDWNAVGGCFHERGDVTRAEFRAANQLGFPGHPAWRFVPPYLADQSGSEIRVRNTGGRVHTFTEVAGFGGGYNAGQNARGSTPAPECANVDPVTGALTPTAVALSSTLAPGGEMRVEGLTPGTHNFQCCIHPWMRSTVRISAEDQH